MNRDKKEGGRGGGRKREYKGKKQKAFPYRSMLIKVN